MAHQHLLTILRPNGQTEVVDMAPKGWGPGKLPAARITEMRAATKTAGRGDVLSYEYRNADTRTPAQRARDEIAIMFDRAERLANGTGEDDFATSFAAARKAKDALAAWRAQYPAEAAAEAAKNAAEADAEKARRDENYRTSFVGRGID